MIKMKYNSWNMDVAGSNGDDNGEIMLKGIGEIIAVDTKKMQGRIRNRAV